MVVSVLWSVMGSLSGVSRRECFVSPEKVVTQHLCHISIQCLSIREPLPPGFKETGLTHTPDVGALGSSGHHPTIFSQALDDSAAGGETRQSSWPTTDQ